MLSDSEFKKWRGGLFRADRENIRKKVRIFLNVIIIIDSYAVMMMFMALIYSLFGRFVHAAGYTKKYPLYDDFGDEI